jgi:hypothetical protein
MIKKESDDTESTPVLNILSMVDVDEEMDFDPYNTATDLFKKNEN